MAKKHKTTKLILLSALKLSQMCTKQFGCENVKTLNETHIIDIIIIYTLKLFATIFTQQ